MSIPRLLGTALLLFFISAPFKAPGADFEVASLDSRVPIMTGWRMSLTDHDAYWETDYDDSAWQKVMLPLSIDQAQSAGSTIIWLRCDFDFASSLKNKKAYLLLGKIDAAIEVYLNGALVYENGKFPPDASYNVNVPKQALLPPGLLRFEETNILAVRLFNELAKFKLERVEVGDYGAFLFDSKFLKFIYSDLYLIYSFMSLVIALYYLLQFFSRRSERTNLHFSLANFFFAVYFINLGLEVHFLPYHFGGAFSQSFMPLFFPMLLIFFVNYFKIHNNKWLKRIVMGLGIVLSLGTYINAGDIQIFPDYFTMALGLSAWELVLMVYISIRATIQKNKDALPIMIGALCGFFLGAHDMIYQFAGLTPFMWLQGTGIFLFNTSMFVSLANRTIRAFNELEVSSTEIVMKTGELETYIENIAELSGKVSGMSAQLDSSIAQSSASAASMSSSSQSIVANIQAQFDTVQKTTATVTGLLDSLEKTYVDLGEQLTHVQETSATIEEMIANIAAIAENVKRTTEFAEELKEITSTGEEAVLASSKSIEEIRVVSENVKKIIVTVSDIAEQTNILSINAAIEASHAGVYGKGFAVVASEIRRLSEGSSRNSREISGLIKTIGERIRLGVETNERAKEVFLSINTRTYSAVDQIQEIYRAVVEQNTASHDILRTLMLLQNASEEIKKQADVQSASGATIRTNLETLVSTSGVVFDMITGISRDIDLVFASIARLKEISADSVQVISRLKTLTEKD